MEKVMGGVLSKGNFTVPLQGPLADKQIFDLNLIKDLKQGYMVTSNHSLISVMVDNGT